jgi:phosphopantetheinyl transferase (holo-ACP synthase)
MVGNDVVDLGERDGCGRERHPRFDERVFAPGERRQLAAADDPEALRWMLWSAKESAYKAARQHRRGTVFSPRRFLAVIDADGQGEVRHAGLRYAVRVTRRGDCIHAVATSGATDDPVLSEAAWLGAPGADESPAGEPGRAARELALASLAGRLRVAPELLTLDRCDRIPRLRHRDRGPLGWLSLSHHGRFVAFAWRAPTGREGR